jgi:hypothetical protein
MMLVGTSIAVIAIEKMTYSNSPTILSKKTRNKKTKRTKQEVKEKKRYGMAMVHSSSAFSHFHSSTQLPSVSSSGPCSSSSLTRNCLSICIHRSQVNGSESMCMDSYGCVWMRMDAYGSEWVWMFRMKGTDGWTWIGSGIDRNGTYLQTTK